MIGIIGYRNHSLKILNILLKLNYRNLVVYCKNKNNLRKIKKCENDFSYSSDKNIDFLSLPSLKKLINNI